MEFLTGKIKPMYLRLLVAASGSAMVASIFGMVDAMMVGRYHGPNGTAAIAIFNPFYSIIYCLGLLAGIGGSVLYATELGRGDKKNANAYFTVSVIFALVLSAIAMLVLGIFQEPLFRAFGADDTLLALVKQYFKSIWYAIPCCVFSNVLSAFLRNDGNPGLAMRAVIIGGILNAIGDYFFVFTLDMGIFGAGLATATGLYVSNIIMLSHFFTSRNTLRLVKAMNALRRVWRISVTGFSTAISDLAMGIINILFNRQIMAFLDANALAVYGIIVQIVAFAQCCAYGAGQAAQPIISQNYGAGQYSRIRECLKYGLGTAVIFGMFWTAVTLIAPNMFVHFFMTPTEEVLEIAPGIIRTYGLSFLLLPFNLFATYYFQALTQQNISLVASLARSVIVSGIMILLLPAIFGANAIWFSMLFTEILVAGFSFWQMKKLTIAL